MMINKKKFALAFYLMMLSLSGISTVIIAQTKPTKPTTLKPAASKPVTPTKPSVSTAQPPATAQIATQKLIVNVTNGRVRSERNSDAGVVSELYLGSIVSPIESDDSWYLIELTPKTATQEAKSGWISKSIVSIYDASRPDSILLEIANKYSNRPANDLNSTKQLLDYLDSAANAAKGYDSGGELRLKRLQLLSKFIGQIDLDKSQSASYAPFFKEFQNELIYHEPAGIWIVRSDQFWQLHSRYKPYKIGELIAWNAARNPLPGECEGYVVCHLNYIRVTSGEYLNFYPNSKHSREALVDIRDSLKPIADDAERKEEYTTATDISDRAELNRILSELRTIVSKAPFAEKATILQQIVQIAEGHR